MSKGFKQLANAIRQQVMLVLNDTALPRHATISSYDPNKHAVKVIVQPVDPDIGEVESNWMPLGAIGIGNGWGVAVGPAIGDQVKVVFEGGDFSSGTIVARIFSTIQVPPVIPTGEIWAVHETGTSLKLVTNGDVDVNGTGNVNITVTNGNVNVNAVEANVTATTSANVTAPAINLGASGQTMLSFVTSAFLSLFNNHTHASSGAGAPNTPMTQSQLTSTVKGA